LSGLSSSIPQPVAGVQGTYGSAWVYARDNQGIERANRRIAEIRQQQSSYEEQLRAYLLFAETLLPATDVAGAVFFERVKNLSSATLRITIRRADLPHNAQDSSIAVELPWHSDDVDRP
ncbi:MAG TPA: hypothetical protein PLZ95_18610, partial [Bryobacteraceae bacterium]|nr:hypothetical protein [Bryobacteraceae bacterium]